MITLLLAGGLGNQMFQYAFARCLALRNGDKLRMSRALRPILVKLTTKAQEFCAVKKFRLVSEIQKFYNR